MKTKQKLFEEESPEKVVKSKSSKDSIKPKTIDSFQTNEDFAKKFEHNKRRELIDKTKDKYGEQALLSGSEESESSSEDDEDDEEAGLINPKFEKKFIETLTMIKNNDPALKKLDGEVFKDSDFEETEEEGEQEKKPKEKPIMYKDQIRQDVLKKSKNNKWDSEDNESNDASDQEMHSADGDEDEEEERGKKSKKKETIYEEERRLKADFIAASKAKAESESDEEGFTLRKKDNGEDEGSGKQIEDMKLE